MSDVQPDLDDLRVTYLLCQRENAELAALLRRLTVEVTVAAEHIEHDYDCLAGMEAFSNLCVCGVERIRRAARDYELHKVLSRYP